MLYFKYNLLNFPPAGRSLFHQFNFDTPTSEPRPSDPPQRGTPGVFDLHGHVVTSCMPYRELFDKDRPTLKIRFTLDNVPLRSQSSRYSSDGL